MALYLITRTDHAEYEEFDEVFVRASSEKAALALVCGYDDFGGEIYRGFRADGSNAQVEEVPVRGGDEVLLTSNVGM
jgi:hypothetical protein